jgi:Zn-dependent peptidase ImmA (M78 family)/DNA-binding XRE family transcriptional regulator
MLGNRLKQARLAAGLSLRVLGERAGISAMAISKYEREESTPSSDVLLRLAKTLDVRTEYFFRQSEVELKGQRYRKHEDLPEKETQRVLSDVRDQLERWIELEQFVPTPWSKALNMPQGLPAQIKHPEEIEDVAKKVREAWDLGTIPIPDLVETIEDQGLKIFMTAHHANHKFDGMVAYANEKPIIVVGKDWPGDRQRFTLAHELGHLVLEGRLSKDIDEEKACHRFAGAFLVPKDRAIEALGKQRTWIEPQELSMLKKEWGLSMLGWVFRARDLDILPQYRATQMWNLFKEKTWNITEPGEPYPSQDSHLYSQLVYRALAEEFIGESKAAELLSMTLSSLRALRNLTNHTDAPNK